MITVLALLVALSLWFWAFFECVATPRDKIRTFSKPVWLITIVVLSWLGAIAWLYFGRPRGAQAKTLGASWPEFQLPRAARPGTTRTLPTAKRTPIGPDDDPDFLSKL